MIYEYLLPVDRRYEVDRGVPSIQPIVSLLRTNRHLHTEVAPIVYGGILFELPIDTQGLAWLKDIGSMKRLIRDVELRGIRRAKFVSFLHQLKQAKDIRTLTIDSRTPRWVDPDKMVRALAPLFKTLRKARRGVQDKNDIIQIFGVVHPADNYTPEQLTSWQADYESGCRTARAWVVGYVIRIQSGRSFMKSCHENVHCESMRHRARL